MAANGKRRSCIRTATSPWTATIVVPRISIATQGYESSSPSTMSRSSYISNACLSIHPRCRRKVGQRIHILEHFPASSIAFYEATPQKLLSQSRFIHPDLNALFLELFNADVYAHLRRAMGLVSACTKEISRSGHALAK